MAAVNRITVTLATGNRDGAGTDGEVFLGIGGREFKLDDPNLPGHGAGASVEYVLGDGATVANKERNDPDEDLRLKTDDLEGFQFPVYIRFKGVTDNDTWNLEAATVLADSSDGIQEWKRMAGNANNLWLGNQFGNVCYLRQTMFLHAG
jgi:hypothetical protein